MEEITPIQFRRRVGGKNRGGTRKVDEIFEVPTYELFLDETCRGKNGKSGR